MSDDLYIGPTALAPGPRHESGDAFARMVLIPLSVGFFALILVFFVLFRAVSVDGPSMVPTLLDSEHMLVTHGDKNLARGDVVVTAVSEDGQMVSLVKRVIGLPGDVVEVRADVAIVNGLAEPQLGQVVLPEYAISVPAIKVPAGMVYVMGDNRAVSSDSRYIGPVPRSGISGKVVAVFAPITRIRFIR